MSVYRKEKGDKMFKFLYEYTMYADSLKQLDTILTESPAFRVHGAKLLYVKTVPEDYERFNNPDGSGGWIHPKMNGPY